MKVCAQCEIEKPLSAFSRSRKTPDGLVSECKDCRLAARESWQPSVTGEEALIHRLLEAQERDLVLVVTAERLREIARHVSRGENDEALAVIRELQMKTPTLADINWSWRATARTEHAALGA